MMVLESDGLQPLSRLTFALQVHPGLGAPAQLQLGGTRRQFAGASDGGVKEAVVTW